MQSTCDAANQCAQTSANAISPLGTGVYFTFNVQFHVALQQWVCVSYFDTDAPVSDSEYYNVADPDVSKSYGWVAN